MNSKTRVAPFISDRIDYLGIRQKDIARKAGFEKPNMITMIKQGRTKLPLDKVGLVAEALEVEPLILLKMCMQEYYPETWRVIGPKLEVAITDEERRLIYALRTFAGAKYLAAVSEESKEHFDRFLSSLQQSEEIV